MAHAYTPGLQVAERMLFLARRSLPIAGEVLVREGDRVNARDVVAQATLPGDIHIVNVAHELGVSAGDVPRAMKIKAGDAVQPGDVIAGTPGLFGWFPSQAVARVVGTVESISNITGQVILRGTPIPVQVRAYATGRVVEVLPAEGVVVESAATFIQGIFGIGGEAYGTLRLLTASPAEPLTPNLLQEDHRGAIVVAGGRIHGAAVRRAIELGVSGIVAGGIDDQDLREILGYDLGVAITGTEQVGLTLIVTEGFGDIAMADRTFSLLKARDRAECAVQGATQIRAGVLRPEIVIPWTDQSASAPAGSQHGGGILQVGSAVRIIRDPYFGLLGQVSALPHEPQVLETGSKARVLKVQCRDGRELSVPRANVEIVST
jgi:hypothetical protein